ncbi:MAG TPA: nucleoside-diphosphate sugar epimerase/dehydratase [Holophagaceae bacterium]|nr:nucleoside-diphosphate sugar epimerase/dehydratase [Holophagaceae bacterium]
MKTLIRFLANPSVRRSGKFALDLALAWCAWFFAVHTLAHGDTVARNAVWYWMMMAATANALFQLSRQHYRTFGFGDGIRLGLALLILLVGALVSAATIPEPSMGLDIPTRAVLLTGLLWLALRSAVRAVNDRADLPDEDVPTLRTLIIGAGKAGVLVAQELKRHRALGAKVVGFVDDAMDKQGVLIQGTPVLGTSELIGHIVEAKSIDQVIFAIPSAPGSVVRALTERLRPLPVKVKTVPGVFDLLGNRTWKPVLQDISIEDLLRREPIALDQSALKEVIEDQVVLITGAGGSIGGELARQVAHFRPARIIILGRGENSLWETERSLRRDFPNQSISLALCDIRNELRLNQVFDQWTPAVVLHAAAHKHVPYLESHPAEAVDNNVFGTRNVLEACLRTGVRTFVNISTDKAVNPTNVLGATKRLAECLVLDAATRAPEGGRYASVRFGNVLGSRGSVVPIFRQQIQQGGPLTVTHPDMTRYFMTIPEASQLVLQAGLLGETGRVYVLDMGEPVKILDLAKDMVRLSGLEEGQDLDIEFTGLRPGEKLYEELFTDREVRQSRVHPKVFDGEPEKVDSVALLRGLDALAKASALPEGDRQREYLHWLKDLVPTYAPSRNGLGKYEEQASGGLRVVHPLRPGGRAV